MLIQLHLLWSWHWIRAKPVSTPAFKFSTWGHVTDTCNLWSEVKSFSCVCLFATPWTVACQISLSILQARILEWVAMPSSRRSSQPRGWTQVSHITDRFFTVWATWEAPQLSEVPSFLDGCWFLVAKSRSKKEQHLMLPWCWCLSQEKFFWPWVRRRFLKMSAKKWTIRTLM